MVVTANNLFFMAPITVPKPALIPPASFLLACSFKGMWTEHKNILNFQHPKCWPNLLLISSEMFLNVRGTICWHLGGVPLLGFWAHHSGKGNSPRVWYLVVSHIVAARLSSRSGVVIVERPRCSLILVRDANPASPVNPRQPDNNKQPNNLP